MYCKGCDEQRATHGVLCKDCAKQFAPYCEVCGVWGYTVAEVQADCECKGPVEISDHYVETH